MKTLFSICAFAILFSSCWKTDWFRPGGDWQMVSPFFYDSEVDRVKNYVAVHFADGGAWADNKTLYVEYSERVNADSVVYMVKAKENAASVVNAVFAGERREACNMSASIVMKVTLYDLVTGQFKTTIEFSFSFTDI
jgi:hypothetical protein